MASKRNKRAASNDDNEISENDHSHPIPRQPMKIPFRGNLYGQITTLSDAWHCSRLEVVYRSIEQAYQQLEWIEQGYDVTFKRRRRIRREADRKANTNQHAFIFEDNEESEDDDDS